MLVDLAAELDGEVQEPFETAFGVGLDGVALSDLDVEVLEGLHFGGNVGGDCVESTWSGRG